MATPTPAKEMPEGIIEQEQEVAQELPEEMTSVVDSADEEEEDVPQNNSQQEQEKTADSENHPHYRDGVLTLAGIVAKRLRSKHPQLAGDVDSVEHLHLPLWLEAHAAEDTCPPSQEWSCAALALDTIFRHQNNTKEKVDVKPGTLKRFLEASKSKTEMPR